MHLFKPSFFPGFTRGYRLNCALSLFIFVIGIALGYGFWQQEPELVRSLLETVLEQLQEISSKMVNLSWFGQALIIFLNNLRVSLLMIFVGSIIPFMPWLVVYSNGMFIGFMAASLGESQALTSGVFFLSLLPHGIFEITAIIISSTVGVVWGARNWLKWLDIRRTTAGYIQNMKNALSFLPLILSLLLVAALIEVLISPHFLPTPKEPVYLFSLLITILI